MDVEIEALLFASYREKAGVGRLRLDLDDSATVGDMVGAMRMRFPGLPEAERIVVAVNNEYQEHDYVLSDGDEVALIPPVSGG